MNRAAGHPVVPLGILRWSWYLVVPPVVGMSLMGFVLLFDDPDRMKTPEVQSLVERLDLPLTPILIFGLFLPFVIGTGIGVFLFAKRHAERFTILFSGAIVLMVVYFSRGLVPLKTEYPGFIVPVRIAGMLALTGIGFLALTFPTGRFEPRWTRIPFGAMTALILAFPTLPEALQELIQHVRPEGAVRTASLIISTVPLPIIAAQVIRYRRAETIQRQQMKWGLVPLLAMMTYVFLMILLPDLIFGVPAWWTGLAVLCSTPLTVAIPLGLARAILRYRLYDLDVVIKRTLVYGSLTAVLAGTYLAMVVVLQQTLGHLSEGSDLTVVASTLAVAGLFRPLRRTIQRFIDRRFYRSPYDATATLQRFSIRLRDEVNLEAVSDELVTVVSHTLRPAHASLWLRPTQSGLP